ncbi:MAG TPA: DUF5989 family protein [Candidatus Limnocylindrales bacterium]|nr:DUF5989 family protein [Candidatus Limnocylindrales bacterium]
MDSDEQLKRDEAARDFQKAAAGRSGNLVGEIWSFLRDNGKWWLLPIIAVLILVGGLIIISGSALAPFIYTLF